MTPDALTGLRALAESLPPGTAIPVPRETLLALLAGTATGEVLSSDTPPADLTVPGVAARFGRHPSTVRAWLERGKLPGAYRLRGREWRIPPAALAAFEAAERAQWAERTQPSATPSARADLGAWRSAS